MPKPRSVVKAGCRCQRRMEPAPPSRTKIRGARGGGHQKLCGRCVSGDTAGAAASLSPLVPLWQAGRSARRGGSKRLCASSLPPQTPTHQGPGSPMMMVQALSSPISFLSVTGSEAPGPGPGPGEGEGAGPGFLRPLGCCVWPAISLSSRVLAPCAVPSIRPAASPSVSPSVGERTALTAGTALTGGRMRWRGARAVGPRWLGPARGGRRAAGSPLPHLP